MKGGKPGLNVRRKGALARLEATYEAFKKAGKDKKNPFTGKTVSYDQEIARMEREMATLKSRIYN
jgi:SMC interacting uncharacterized protein involved in chromosome segregation